MAHELWHHIEHAFETTRYGDAVGLRRGLGEFYGVEARRRLVAEVSDYATTNVVEATAEMFVRWWHAPDEVSGVVARFGELVERFFPR